MQVTAALLGWLARNPILLMDLVRPDSLEGLFLVGSARSCQARHIERNKRSMPWPSCCRSGWVASHCASSKLHS